MRAIRRALTGTGITVALDKSRVFVRATGTVGDFERTFKMGLVAFASPPSLQIQPPVNGKAPTIPAALRGRITETVWSSVSQLAGSAGHVNGEDRAPSSRAALRGSVPAPTNHGSSNACGTVSANPNMMAMNEASQAYGDTRIRDQLGYGVKPKSSPPRIGIISMGSGFSQSAANAAAQCLGWSSGPARVVTTDAMTSALAEGVEGDLDIQMSSAILGRSNQISVYEEMNSQPASFLPFFAALNDKKRPDVLSVSYGSCEYGLQNRQNSGSTKLTNAVLLRLSLAGTSTAIAAGDTGSSTCKDSNNIVKPFVSFPASSPYVTAVGGSRIVLDQTNSRINEVVWNDSAFYGGSFNTPNINVSGGGGGTSRVFSRPWWQRTPRTGTSAKRTLPDVSAHGSGAPAWPIFITSSTDPNQIYAQTVWGTSSSTPLFASSIALVVARERAKGKPSLGMLNPWLYSIKKPYQSAFYDIRGGNNDLYQVGCCSARPGYDRASGIGSANFASLQNTIRRPG